MPLPLGDDVLLLTSQLPPLLDVTVQLLGAGVQQLDVQPPPIVGVNAPLLPLVPGLGALTLILLGALTLILLTLMQPLLTLLQPISVPLVPSEDAQPLSGPFPLLPIFFFHLLGALSPLLDVFFPLPAI